MREHTRILSIVVAAIVLLALITTAALAGPPIYRPHLETLGFDTLGAPGTGLNSEIVIDAGRDFAYVGALFGDNDVKAVDVSDPTNPTMTASVTVLGGDLGPFDVKIAGDILAASIQGSPPSNPGVTLMDISDPATPVPVSHIGAADLKSPFGSHNSFLWADPLTGQTWLFATGLDNTSLMLFDVTDPANPVFAAEYHNGNQDPFVHDNFVQENNDRVLEYQVGSIGAEILDVTRIVRGGQPGPLTSGDVVALNHYTSDPADAATVTRPGFAHYVEPTASGDVTWVGDETECGQPAIVRSFDSSNLPLPGDPPKFLSELGTIIENPDPALQCAGLIHGGSVHSQSQAYRWTGHNFDIWGNGLMIRGDYGRGVDVYDISDPAAAVRVAQSRGLNQGVGNENKANPGRETFFEIYPWVWAAVYDGDLIYASDINQGIYVLDLIGD